MLKRKVKQFIERQGLLKTDEKTLVALSGGADSVALLRVLMQLGFSCEAAHCNFHLRGDESDRDEAFVKELCEELQVGLHVQHFHTKEYAREYGISIEMAARELRYNWFEQLRQETGCQWIAVAHHQDDSIETFLLNLIRGTGIKGLRGIQPKNGFVIRPLLCVNRSEVLDYLQELKQPFVNDSSNLLDDYTRNTIRHKLIPMLETINPSFRQSLLQTADHLNEVHHIYNNCIVKGKDRVKNDRGIDIAKLQQEPSPQSLLYEIASPLGFNSAQVADMMEALTGQSGKVFESKEWHIIKDRTHLLIEPAIPPTPPELETDQYLYSQGFEIPRDKHTACFDADKLNDAISVRLCRPGDWFVPFGMKGRKLISDFLTDLKKNVSQKANQYVLCCGNDVIWVIGERIDNRFRVTNSTKRVVIFRKKA